LRNTSKTPSLYAVILAKFKKNIEEWET